MLKQRLLTAAIGIPVLVGVTLLGGPLFSLVIGLIVARGLWEFYALAASSGVEAYRRTGIVAGLLVVLVASIEVPLQVFVSENSLSELQIEAFGRLAGMPLLLAILFGMGLTFVVAMRAPDLKGSLLRWSVTLGGVLYVALLASFFILLRGQEPDGWRWVFVVLAGTFATDTSAFAVGSLIGRHRMAPRISPGKTWEGFAGGIVGGVLGFWLASMLLGLPYSGLFAVLLGVPVAILAQAGDLSESLLKRGAGAKDAGTFFPGHGGILDRLDSLGFVVPLIYLVSIWVLA